MEGHMMYSACEGKCEFICTKGECVLVAIKKCKLCGGEYGSLTSDCPQILLSDVTLSEILNGRLNYIEGKGWVEEYSPYQMIRIRDLVRKVLYGKMSRSAVFKSVPSLTSREYDQLELSVESDLVKLYGFVRKVLV